MADSKDNNDSSSESFLDDFDATLNNEESSDDEDVIERLLMDDTFGKKEAAAIDDTDQLPEDNQDSEDSMIQKGEFSEDTVESESDYDFSDDEFSNSTDEEVDEWVEDDLSPGTEDLDIESSSVGENGLGISDSAYEEVAVEPSVLSQPVIEEINTQISQLWDENETVKRKIAELTASTGQFDSINEELDTLYEEQKTLGQTIEENGSRMSVISYAAIGLAIIALLAGIGFGAVGYGARSDVTDLSNVVAAIEEEKVSTKNSVLQPDSLKPVIDDLLVQNQRNQDAIELLIAKVETLEKNKTVTKTATKPEKVVEKATWVVNLVSFKQESSANKKAAEFNKKGVATEVIKVKIKGENWFRLRVKGFKSKQEALAYVDKVKKTLNLESVWVEGT